MNLKTITLVTSDIDGVLTDGHIILDANGGEQKRIYMRDLDAINVGRGLGLDIVLITGEDNLLAKTIARRFGIEQLILGAKDKLFALQSICAQKNLAPESVCYIGDGDRDAAAIAWAGFGVAPADGSATARHEANYVTQCAGGKGVLAEVIDLIRSNEEQG